MITQFAKVQQLCCNALASRGRSAATIENYTSRINKLIRIHQQLGKSHFDIAVLENYLDKRLAYLQAIGSPKDVGRRDCRTVNLIIGVMTSGDSMVAANSFIRSVDTDVSFVQLPTEWQSLFQTFLQHLSSDLHFSQETIRSYTHRIRGFLNCAFKLHPVSSIRKLKRSNILDTLHLFAQKNTLSIKTALNGPTLFFRWLYEEGLITENLSEVLRVQVSKRQPPVRSFSHGDVEKLLSALDINSADGILMHSIISLISFTGIRGIDLENLRISDIDWGKKRILIRQSKTNKIIALPIVDPLAISLSRYLLKVRPLEAREFVFVNPRFPFNRLSRKEIRARFTNLRNRVLGSKWAGYSLHALRRGLGTELFKQETPLPLIQEILGHSSETAVWSYVRSDYIHLQSCCLPIPTGE